MTHVTIGRCGRNLALRVPNDIATQIGLHEGDRVEIETEDGIITIRRAEPRYTLDDLFAGRSAAEWRDLYAGAYDWGPDLGREVVEE